MSAVCGPAAEAVTRDLGFDCHDVSPVVSVRSPWELAHWTMPLLEVLIIGGAVFALVHAVRRTATAIRSTWRCGAPRWSTSS